MTARLVQKPVKGKASCLPIQEELNDNPYRKDDEGEDREYKIKKTELNHRWLTIGIKLTI